MHQNGKFARVICSSAPKPVGHYAQGLLHGNTLYVSGQLGLTPDASCPEDVPLADQVKFALTNVERIGAVVGASRADVVKVTIYVPDVGLWDEANRAYSEFFGDHKPARSVVPTRELHLGSRIEIDAILAVA